METGSVNAFEKFSFEGEKRAGYVKRNEGVRVGFVFAFA